MAEEVFFHLVSLCTVQVDSAAMLQLRGLHELRMGSYDDAAATFLALATRPNMSIEAARRAACLTKLAISASAPPPLASLPLEVWPPCCMLFVSQSGFKIDSLVWHIHLGLGV